MRYLQFRIRNFKGIKDAEINLRTATGANVFALVGLNESGKTTILEAIHSFSPDYRTRSLRRAELRANAAEAKDRLPRHLLARFSGEIVVEAVLALSDEDKAGIVVMAKDDGLTISASDLPDTIALRRTDIFDRGDYVNTLKTFDFELLARRKGERKPKPLSELERESFYVTLWNFTPDIAYHDSFIFDFPSRIFLTERHGSNDWVYRKMFEDVLAAGRVPYTLDDLTRRVRDEKYKTSWTEFFTAWSTNDDRSRVQQIIDQTSETITRAVFGKWNKIFKEDVGKKEISVQFGTEKGHTFNRATKTYADADEHDLYVWLEIKDGTRRFPIQDRSLGFRWFFAFLLFTQFRTKRNENRPVLFLFDEPAANLHSAAQGRLIESFPEIATGDNMLIYSTHSHYMISPDWLEQTFIVTNAADAPGESVVDSAVIEDDSLNVKAQLYREFANEHPSETSYFQPIMDRMEIVPSKFDVAYPSIVVEGKSDYYLLRYAQLLHNDESVRIIPATGSGTFEALIGLGATWGTKFVFLLDSDNAGIKERHRYALGHGARTEAIYALSDADVRLKEIEDLLDQEAKSIIGRQLDLSKPSKKAMLRFFQEQLAKRQIVPLGGSFGDRSRDLLLKLDAKLQSL